MKKISIIGVTILSVTTILILLSFKKVKPLSPPPSLVTYYNIAFQRIDAGYFEECSYESSLQQNSVCNTQFWTTSDPGDCEYTSNGNYLCSIGFDAESTADGGSDGQLTLQEAINAVWNYYNAQSPKSLPQGGANPSIVEGNATIYIYRKQNATICQ
jgi:hypothetical protein